MPYILLLPLANSVVQMTAFPVVGQNFNSVNNYPIDPGNQSYLINSFVPSAQTDLFTKPAILALNLDITSIAIVFYAYNFGALPTAVTIASIFNIAGVPYTHAALPINALTYTRYSYVWDLNPATSKKWTVANVNAITNFGIVSTATATDWAHINNIYMLVNYLVAGEYVSNFSPHLSDNIQVNQDYSIVADSPASRNLLRCTVPKILYKLPSGVTGSLDAEVSDETKLIAKMPAATNIVAGKTLFKLSCTLPGGQLLEGDTFFANILSRWV